MVDCVHPCGFYGNTQKPCSRAQAMSQLNLSARAYHRTRSVKLARTIADLSGSEEIQSAHLAEALQYRPKIMMG